MFSTQELFKALEIFFEDLRFFRRLQMMLNKMIKGGGSAKQETWKSSHEHKNKKADGKACQEHAEVKPSAQE